MWLDFIFFSLLVGGSFSFLQKTFRRLYTPGVYPIVSLVMAILYWILADWKEASVFFIAQGVGYIISFRIIKPYRHYSPWGGDAEGRHKWFRVDKNDNRS